jgi:ribosome-associated heat shock protein Hsp15
MDEARRIDQWLWFARLVKTRTLAAKLVSDGAVRLNKTRVLKPSHPVCPGDTLVFAHAGRVRIMTIQSIGDRRGPASEAATLYCEHPKADEILTSPMKGEVKIWAR